MTGLLLRGLPSTNGDVPGVTAPVFAGSPLSRTSSCWVLEVRRSQVRRIPSSPPLHIQRPSELNPTLLTFPSCPSKMVSGAVCGCCCCCSSPRVVSLLRVSKIRMAGLPATAKKCLFLVRARQFTCYYQRLIITPSQYRFGMLKDPSGGTT